MFSDQDQFNSSPEKNYYQQLQQETQPRQIKEEKKKLLNLSKIDTTAGKNTNQLGQQESSGRGSNRAAKIEFKLLQSDEPMSSARATDDKPKIGGLNLANALKINSSNLNRFQDEQNSSPNNSPKWPQDQSSPTPIVANRGAQKSGMGKLNLDSKLINADNDPQQKLSITQKEQTQTPLSLSNLGQNIPKTQMEQVKMIQQRGLDPANFGRDTTRMQQQHLKFKNQISQIIDGLLYLGGQYVASNKQQLMDTGITHIINCASDYCPSPYVDQFKYKNYHLKDTKQQSIECVFYDAIAFIEQAKASGGKVFVHCVQGISRSSTICMSYLIFTTKIDLNQALAYVQSRRQIANPNLNFIIQLIWFHRRLYQEYKELSNSVNPRIFLISSHQKEDPHFITARLLIEQLFKQKNGKKFDPKGVFLIQSQTQFAVWVGKDCKGLTKDKYLQKALSYIKTIHKYQSPAKKIKLSKDLKQVRIYQQGQQDHEFLELWKNSSSSKPVLGEPFSQKVHEWEEIFRDLEKCDEQDEQQGGFNSPSSSPQKVSTNPTTSSGGNSLVEQGEADQEEDEISEKDQKPKQFYEYPNPTENIGDLQVQQLIPNKLYVLCVTDTYTMEKTAYIWKGEQFQSNQQLSEESFVDKCILNYFGGKSDVIIYTENIDDQSDRFMNYLY